jgi:hypothetical protein
MAVKLIANYSKRLGLPGYSSHQFSVSVETELMNVDDVADESERLYSLLQKSVDEQMQNTGFVPPDGYGMEPANGNGRHRTATNGNGNGHSGNNGNSHRAPADNWNCTEGQQKLILQLVHDHRLDKAEIETMAQQLFGIGVKQLNKMQASNLIDDLLEKVGKKSNGGRPRWQNREGART